MVSRRGPRLGFGTRRGGCTRGWRLYVGVRVCFFCLSVAHRSKLRQDGDLGAQQHPGKMAPPTDGWSLPTDGQQETVKLKTLLDPLVRFLAHWHTPAVYQRFKYFLTSVTLVP